MAPKSKPKNKQASKSAFEKFLKSAGFEQLASTVIWQHPVMGAVNLTEVHTWEELAGTLFEAGMRNAAKEIKKVLYIHNII